jgi:hypothetical protein
MEHPIANLKLLKLVSIIVSWSTTTELVSLGKPFTSSGISVLSKI